MKKALVIGTSHSEATCMNEETGIIERITEGRWQDYLEDYNYEVTTLARAACTVQHQFLTTYAYLQDNPDVMFDLVIIEGRSLEANASVPSSDFEGCEEIQVNDKFNYEELYRRWLRYPNVKLPEPSEFVRTDARNVMRDFPEYAGWLADYLQSVLHGVDTWSVNLALIHMLQKRAKVIKWFTFATTEKYHPVKRKVLKELEMGRVLLEDYLLSNSLWPAVQFGDDDEFDASCYCVCRHLNEKGHRLLWKKYIKPNLREYL